VAAQKALIELMTKPRAAAGAHHAEPHAGATHTPGRRVRVQ